MQGDDLGGHYFFLGKCEGVSCEVIVKERLKFRL